ncbi:Protein of unknown function [Mesorhizobium albiziae]|uniref:DUF2971 domain-containing protein n=2 Tax=Neomesorhizobium albiziae TaxID=335020 RepID=A0A1I4EK75_9HYPH|nr:hypothetical protein GCM10007937_37370 [Mesorhizobium albiziae]SFL04967.1 Protein of unknown function [Mesorhizobium albiziae]
MMLYKYVPFERGRQILEGSAVSFTRREFFNDPFDFPAYPQEPQGDPVSGFFANVRAWAKAQTWAEHTGILSLTRTAANPLMWSHYADQHRGLVIGIDAVAAGLTEESRNLIPAQYGSVIYVSRRLAAPFITPPETGIAVGSTYHFPHDHYEKLQRLFLHKPLCWSYEEEVRVVKCLKGVEAEPNGTPSGSFEIIRHDGRATCCYRVPPSAIQELYVGLRAAPEAANVLVDGAKARLPGLAVHDSFLETGSFSIGFKPYGTAEETAVAHANEHA